MTYPLALLTTRALRGRRDELRAAVEEYARLDAEIRRREAWACPDHGAAYAFDGEVPVCGTCLEPLELEGDAAC